MYEYVKKEIRARYGKDAINDKNKHKLKSLAIAAPLFVLKRASTSEMGACFENVWRGTILERT